MENELLELDRMQGAYKTAVEEWITAIRHEEALASVIHSVAEVDQWEGRISRKTRLVTERWLRRNNTRTRFAKSSLASRCLVSILSGAMNV